MKEFDFEIEEKITQRIHFFVDIPDDRDEDEFLNDLNNHIRKCKGYTEVLGAVQSTARTNNWYVDSEMYEYCIPDPQ